MKVDKIIEAARAAGAADKAVYQSIADNYKKPQAEHDLKDIRCECCGYMTYHREHMGCIRAASKQSQAEAAHPAVKPDTLVNRGALQMALNVLRRAGKDEVADELEKTIQQPQAEAVPPGWKHACYLWVDPETKNYEVDHCEHPISELIPAYIKVAAIAQQKGASHE